MTQEIIMLGGGHISPDKTKLAMWQENEIVIWDLDKGEVGRVQGLAKNLQNGEIAWSPGGQSIAYLQTQWDCAPDYGTTYVTRLDLADMRQTLLFKFQPPGFGRLSWDAPDQITLTDGMGKQSTYSLMKREIILNPTPPTPVPPGIFILFFYEPLVMEYDPSMWEDRSNYAEWGTNRNPATGTIIENYLQAKDLKSCAIGVQGPTDFQQVTPEKVQLGDVQYQVITFLENESVSAFYIEDHSLSEYNYEHGLPIPVIQASSSEWNECKALAEEVLATLHVP